MRLPRRSMYAIVATILALNLILRYPLTGQHEFGSDTSYIHSLASSLSSSGHAAWTLSPLSYLGLYALSYPSAGPFLSAMLTVTAGQPLEASFWLESLLFGLLGPIGMLLFGRSITSDDRLAVVLATLMSFAPFYIKDTTWTGSTRGYAVALIPIVLFLCVRFLQTADYRILPVLLLVCIVMSLFHRMGVLTTFLVVGVLFVVPFHLLTMRLRFHLYRFESSFRVASLGLALAGFLGMFFIQFRFPGVAGIDVQQEYGTGTFFSGNSFGVLLANMAVSFVGKVGILIPLVALGLPLYMWKRPKEAVDKFVLLSLLIFLPLLSMRDYLTEFVIPLLTVFMGYTLFRLVGHSSLRRHKAASVAIMAVVIVSSMGFAWVMRDYWANRYVTDAGIPESIYTAALYSHVTLGGSLLSNNGLDGGRISAISGVPALPVGGASLHWYSAQQLTFGYVDGTTIQVQPLSIFKITLNTDEIYVPTNVRNAETDWETILYAHLADPKAKTLMDTYHVEYVAVSTDNPKNTFLSYGIYRDSPFLADVAVSCYTTFAQPDLSIYFVG